MQTLLSVLGTQLSRTFACKCCSWGLGLPVMLSALQSGGRVRRVGAAGWNGGQPGVQRGKVLWADLCGLCCCHCFRDAALLPHGLTLGHLCAHPT